VNKIPRPKILRPTEVAAVTKAIQRESVNGGSGAGSIVSPPMDGPTSPIRLVWPPSALSGHAKGHWHDRDKAALVKKHRAWAHVATLEARPVVPASGDIALRITFVPPDRRSDRTNMPNRMKAAIDGIADALRINDRRFDPSYVFLPPCKPGWVLVEVG
jgi:crossover junction endodeoxyribonuclease RusA